MPTLRKFPNESILGFPPKPDDLTVDEWNTIVRSVHFCANYRFTLDDESQLRTVSKMLKKMGAYPYWIDRARDTLGVFRCRRCGHWHMIQEWYLVDPAPFELVSTTPLEE